MSRVAAIAASSLLLACPELAEGHAYLIEPPSRNSLAQKAGQENSPHSMQSGGPSAVKARGSHIWPTVLDPRSHGLCGDPRQNSPDPADLASSKYMVPTEVQRTYKPGEIVEFRIGMNAHHRGHYEFRICDKSLDGSRLSSNEEGQECLNKWVLERAPVDPSCGNGGNNRADCQPVDEKHPGRWYIPPPDKGTPVAGSDFKDDDAPSYYAASEYHRMRYKIPEDLSCEHCTLQWYWATGNTCLYDVDYVGADGYFGRNQAAFQALGWSTEEWCPFCLLDWVLSRDGSCNWCCKTGGSFGEEFWNCADIAVTGSGAGPAPSPSPPATTTAAVTTTASVKTTTTTTMAVVTTTQTCGGGEEGLPRTVCLARRDGMALKSGATDAKCHEACKHVPSGQWPCNEQGPCGCVELLPAAPAPAPAPPAPPATTAAPSTTTAAPTTTTAAPTTAATTTTTAATTTAGSCAGAWEQCGGKGFDGPTCCSSGWQCKYGNPWYSQCLKA